MFVIFKSGFLEWPSSYFCLLNHLHSVIIPLYYLSSHFYITYPVKCPSLDDKARQCAVELPFSYELLLQPFSFSSLFLLLKESGSFDNQCCYCLRTWLVLVWAYVVFPFTPCSCKLEASCSVDCTRFYFMSVSLEKGVGENYFVVDSFLNLCWRDFLKNLAIHHQELFPNEV